MKLVIVLLVCASSLVHGQERSVVAYFDKDWQPAKDSLHAEYYLMLLLVAPSSQRLRECWVALG